MGRMHAHMAVAADRREHDGVPSILNPVRRSLFQKVLTVLAATGPLTADLKSPGAGMRLPRPSPARLQVLKFLLPAAGQLRT